MVLACNLGYTRRLGPDFPCCNFATFKGVMVYTALKRLTARALYSRVFTTPWAYLAAKTLAKQAVMQGVLWMLSMAAMPDHLVPMAHAHMMTSIKPIATLVAHKSMQCDGLPEAAGLG